MNLCRATRSPTQTVNNGGHKLAYRSIGSGPTLILCTRFRGTLDTWDPAFLDSLAAHFRVITFDYSGIGQSTGEPSCNPKNLANDAISLADALGESRFIIGGWSLGGRAAQIVAAIWPERVTQVVLISTAPLGKNNFGPTPTFSTFALSPNNNLDEEIMLFFEPMSAESRDAARASRDRIALRTHERSPDVPEEVYMSLLRKSVESDFLSDDCIYRNFLEETQIPILVIAGDHDIGFPVENWYNLTRRWRSLYLNVMPRSGNAVQHQYPFRAARLVNCFVTTTSADLR